MEEQPLVGKKLLGKTLSITKAQFSLCLAVLSLDASHGFFNSVRLPSGFALAHWPRDIMRPERNRRPLITTGLLVGIL